MHTTTAPWHPTYCLNKPHLTCHNTDDASHDDVVFQLPDREATVIANLFVLDWPDGTDRAPSPQPIPLVIIDSHHDYAMSPAQARAFAHAVLVAADEAEQARDEWKQAHQ